MNILVFSNLTNTYIPAGVRGPSHLTFYIVEHGEDGTIVMLMNNKSLKMNMEKRSRVSHEMREPGKELGLELQSTEVAILGDEIESYFFIYDGDIHTCLKTNNQGTSD